MSKKVMYLFSFVLFLSIFALQANKASALTNMYLVGDNQSHYVMDGSKGGSRTFSFVFENVGDYETKITVYPSDQLTAKNGGSIYTPVEEKATLYGTWLNEDRYDFTLQPDEKQKVDYTITVPDNLEAGQYIAVVAAQETLPDRSESLEIGGDQVGASVKSAMSLGKQIVVNVKETESKKSIDIDSMSFAYSSGGIPEVSVKLKNTGTILQKPKTTVQITGKDGKTYPVLLYTNSLSFYGGTTQTVQIPFSDVIPEGDYEATVSVEYDTDTVERKFPFTVTRENYRDALIQANAENKINLPDDLLKTLEEEGKGVTLNHMAILFYAVILALVVYLFYFILFRRKRKEKKEEETGNNINKDEE